MSHVLLTLAVAFFFAVIHLASPRLKPLVAIPPAGWLSFAGGLSVGYVFIHVLPELAGHQAELSDPAQVATTESEIFLMALLGLAAFYALEHLARKTAADVGEDDEDARSRHPGFWLHILSFSLYNALIGYLLVERDGANLRELAFYTVALGVHFFVNDRSLSRHHGPLHDRYGRWILAGSVILGWAIGVTTPVDSDIVAFLFAFLAGGIILNVLKEELPEEKEGHVGAFALGAATYVLIAMLV
jgi:zinc transporter ZupT